MGEQTAHGMPRNYRPCETIKLTYPGERYLGMLFHYAGYGWVHSIQRFEEPPFPTIADAQYAFDETKKRLPADVHKALFGEE